MIRKSWCKNFADIVFPAINEERFSVRYSENHAARPNTPVNFIVGSLMLKENNGLTDEELVESSAVMCGISMRCIRHTSRNGLSVKGRSAISTKDFTTAKWKQTGIFSKKK